MKLIFLALGILFSFSILAFEAQNFEQTLEQATGAPVACAPVVKELCEDPMSLCHSLPRDKFETNKYDIRKAASPTGVKDPFEKPFEELMKYSRDIELARVNAGAQTYTNGVTTKPEEIIERYDQSSKTLATLITSAETKILQKFGKTNKDLNQIIENLKVSLNRQAEKDFKTPVPEAIAKKLRELKFNSASSLETNPNNVKSFTEACSGDGLAKNAFYNANENALTLCPGFLLDSLLKSNGALENLSMVIGHELGHSLHGADFTSGQYTNNPPHFNKFIACMSANFIENKDENFGTNAETLNQLKEGLPKVKAEIEKVLNTKPVDMNYLSDLKRSLAAGEQQIEEFTFFTNFPDKRFSVKGELIADYESAVTIRDYLSLTPANQRAQKLSEMAQFYCPKYTENEKKVMALKWGTINPASHPPSKFRLENYFRNPEVRNLIGCAPLSASDKPWCSIDGPKRSIP